LYQRDGEIIAFARPDLAVSGMGSWPVAQVVDIELVDERNHPVVVSHHKQPIIGLCITSPIT
jgi:hypothetical protein